MEENDEKVLDFVAYREQKEYEKFLEQYATEENYQELRYVYNIDKKAKRSLLKKRSKAQGILKKDKKQGVGYAIASVAAAGVAIGALYSAIQNFKMGMSLVGAACVIGTLVCAGISAFCAFCSGKKFKKAVNDATEIKKLDEAIENVDGDLKCVHQDLERVAFYLGKEC